MMTIKEFASLCNCNTQTLRYYDKIDLLKPVKVDQWSGYRYYEKSQAIDFIKIKNLQAADFTIEEIKGLLTMTDQQVYEAFDRKLAEQEQKLERIRKIQQSYLTEVNTMKQLIHSFCDSLLESVNTPEMLQEFATNDPEADKTVEIIRSLMLSSTEAADKEAQPITMEVNGKLFEGAQALENMTLFLRKEELKGTLYLNDQQLSKDASAMAENTEVVWEFHGWNRTHEFLSHIPVPGDNRDYILLIRHPENSVCNTLAYPMVLLGMLISKGFKAEHLHCFSHDDSEDGQNHVTLLRRK